MQQARFDTIHIEGAYRGIHVISGGGIEVDTANGSPSVISMVDIDYPRYTPAYNGKCTLYSAATSYKFGDQVTASDGVCYQSKLGYPGTAINQGNDPAGGANPAYWKSLSTFYNDWDAGGFYLAHQRVTLRGLNYYSLQNGNIGNDPSISPAFWAAAGVSTPYLRAERVTYQGYDYLSIQEPWNVVNPNIDNQPDISPTWWLKCTATPYFPWQPGTAYEPGDCATIQTPYTHATVGVWSAAAQYSGGDMVYGSDGIMYTSLNGYEGNWNQGNDPTTPGSGWWRVAAWDPAHTYQQFDRVVGSDTYLYYSSSGDNLGKDPTIYHPELWVPSIYPVMADYDNTGNQPAVVGPRWDASAIYNKGDPAVYLVVGGYFPKDYLFFSLTDGNQGNNPETGPAGFWQVTWAPYSDAGGVTLENIWAGGSPNTYRDYRQDSLNVYRGFYEPYDATRAYGYADEVGYNGVIWASTQVSTGHQPDVSPEFWVPCVATGPYATSFYPDNSSYNRICSFPNRIAVGWTASSSIFPYTPVSSLDVMGGTPSCGSFALGVNPETGIFVRLRAPGQFGGLQLEGHAAQTNLFWGVDPDGDLAFWRINTPNPVGLVKLPWPAVS